MPLSGEAIRVMNLVDDVATTMRRMIALIPALAPDERKRVSDYLKQSERHCLFRLQRGHHLAVYPLTTRHGGLRVGRSV